MPTSRAEVPTESGSRYLQQLCKHWAHKFEVTFTPEHGEIALPAGRAVLDAAATHLTVEVRADDEAAIERLETVVADHVKRFAFREELAFSWQRGA